MHTDDSTIRVQLFAGAAAIAGTRMVDLNLSELSATDQEESASPVGQSTVRLSAVRSELLSRFPELAALAEVSRFAVDNEFASEDTEVNSAQSVALIPPVSGG
ncbi:MAG: hypothetical protein Aurels2KO_29010 [Aureliella sp.]